MEFEKNEFTKSSDIQSRGAFGLTSDIFGNQSKFSGMFRSNVRNRDRISVADLRQIAKSDGNRSPIEEPSNSRPWVSNH